MYKTWFYIDTPIGNNEFHYDERIALWSEGKIFIPNLIQWTVADLEEGSEIVFEEVVDNKIVSCTGLKHFIKTEYKWIPTYIFDNHNHALFFRYRHTKQFEDTKPFVVIHIDQHADTKPNNAEFRVQNSEWIEDFITTKTNVGNFISAAIHNNIIDEVIQIRSQHALHNMEALDFHNYNYILDIDVDFREQKTDQEMESDFEIIKRLVDNVCLITIASSPYFMNQKKAIEIIRRLLS